MILFLEILFLFVCLFVVVVVVVVVVVACFYKTAVMCLVGKLD